MNSTTYVNSTYYGVGEHVVESQQGPLVGMQIFLLSIAIIFCSLRMYSRIAIVRSLGPDDYLMIAATVWGYRCTYNALLMLTSFW
jgi:hypothetical protein